MKNMKVYYTNNWCDWCMGTRYLLGKDGVFHCFDDDEPNLTITKQDIIYKRRLIRKGKDIFIKGG